MNQVQVSPAGSQHVPYRAMFEALLDRTINQRARILESGLFIREKPKHLDDCGDSEDGFVARWIYTNNSKSVELSGPLMVDMAQQPRLILSGVELMLRLWPAPHSFTLLTKEKDCTRKIELEDIFVRVCRVQPAPAVTLAINATLQKTPALYPHSRCQVKKYLLTAGQFNFRKRLRPLSDAVRRRARVRQRRGQR